MRSAYVRIKIHIICLTSRRRPRNRGDSIVPTRKRQDENKRCPNRNRKREGREECVYVCATFVVFTDCENCTRPISTNPVSMEAREYGLTRETCFFCAPSRGGRGRRAAEDLVVCFVWGGFFRVFQVTTFSNLCPSTRPLAARDPEQSASTT